MKNIELEFILERERRYLLKNPFKAINLALSYLEDFLHLSKEFKVLEQKYQSLMADNQKLTSQLINLSSPTRDTKDIVKKRKTVSRVVKLPSFLACHRH